jgi:hypothetical protein
MTGAEEDIWYEKTEVTDPSCGKMGNEELCLYKRTLQRT